MALFSILSLLFYVSIFLYFFYFYNSFTLYHSAFRKSFELHFCLVTSLEYWSCNPFMWALVLTLEFLGKRSAVEHFLFLLLYYIMPGAGTSILGCGLVIQCWVFLWGITVCYRKSSLLLKDIIGDSVSRFHYYYKELTVGESLSCVCHDWCREFSHTLDRNNLLGNPFVYGIGVTYFLLAILVYYSSSWEIALCLSFLFFLVPFRFLKHNICLLLSAVFLCVFPTKFQDLQTKDLINRIVQPEAEDPTSYDFHHQTITFTNSNYTKGYYSRQGNETKKTLAQKNSEYERRMAVQELLKDRIIEIEKQKEKRNSKS